MSEDTDQPNEFVLPKAFYIHFNDIDPQHEALVGIVNDCAAHLSDGVLKDFERPFATFVEKLTAHFHHEEEQMRDLGYTGLEWHADHHRECLRRVTELVTQIRGQGYAGIRELRVCFHGIIFDIAHADLKFGEFLDGQGLSQRS
jgi:hemerythrin-like metal-binding protein